ncbi:MAG: M1 family aminopeptidase, partial [Rhodothermales bacterium]|nr:M1 family aminopeptidase [Rhodothermales bacterium]
MPDRWLVVAVGLLVLASVWLVGCRSAGPTIVEQEVAAPSAVEVAADSIPLAAAGPFARDYRVIPAETPQPFARSGLDILHGTVEMMLDLDVAEAVGVVAYDFVVLRDGLPEFSLWTLGTAVDSVELTRDSTRLRLDVSFDSESIIVQPGVPLGRADTLRISIFFKAGDRQRSTAEGVHFVDAFADDPSLPTQVWCGGMTPGNPTCWPVLNDPDELMTFDLRLAVPDTFTTLASGELVAELDGGDGLRVDHWSVDVPQPSTRVGFAIGQFALIGDEYVSPVGKRLPLVFATDPGVVDLADAVFAPTREMINTVERRTAVEYPFGDYKQVVVQGLPRTTVSPASLSLHDASILRDERELLDETGESRIMRGVAAQWFGGWVGAADWVQVPLLQGLTHLFEAFYAEEEYGRTRLQEELIEARERYMDEAREVRRPLISSMARDHAHGQAGLVDRSALVQYQLASYIGEETWWRGVRDFTARAGWRAASIDDFRDSAEKAARRNLDRYFDEWFVEPGHPELVVEHEDAAAFGVYEMQVRQVQDSSHFPTYALETDVAIYFENSPEYRERVRISSRDTTLRFGFAGRISFVRFDARNSLLADVLERKPVEQWIAQVEYDPSV